MHQFKDKKLFFYFIFLTLFFLSSINSQQFMEKKESLYDLQSIEVIGLDASINLEIEKNLNFLKKTNIFFLNRQILKDQINKFNFIESYNIFKLYPSKIILKLQRADFLALTIKNNEIVLIGSNSKFINTKKFSNYEDLPLVYGKFTAEKFISFKKIFNKSDLNYNNIKEIFFYPSGRIDIKNKNDVLIKFPIQNIEEALIIASKIINNENFKNNVIDLRVPNQLILSNE
tara:strand:- start:3890 stop:4579 length:690 start_codon:yes stop_codon:yes gene_type:complete